MIFNIDELNVELLKSFDGINNYFNPSHFNNTTIFRKESKFENKVSVSDLIDNDNNIILSHNFDENYLYSYEDCRFINKNEISVCVVARSIKNLENIIYGKLKKYNLKTKVFTDYKMHKTTLEKNWQFYEDKIIYHLNPYIIMDENENLLFTINTNWNKWIDNYGNPHLSTNIFEIDNIKYMLYHSKIISENTYIKYYIGILKLDDNLKPISYFTKPLFVSSRFYSDLILLNNLWKWRKTEIQESWKYEVIFAMNVFVDDININIYSGMNDCSAVNIKIPISIFIDKIKNESYEYIK
jgi:hypothetical protein